MTTIVKSLCMSAVLFLGAALLPGASRAEDVKTPPSPKVVLTALAEAGKPGAEHQKLSPFIGEWNVTMRMWTDPTHPPAEMKGTVESRWILGGRFVQETLRGECPEGKSFEALGFLGYDAAQKKFTAVRVCGFCGKTMTTASTADSAGKKFECATEECCPVTGEKVKGRDEIVVETNDRIVTSIYKTMNGKEFKAMEVVATRRK